MAVSALSEASEEAIEGMLQPVLQNMTYTEDASVDWSDVVYQALIGGLLGGIGGTVSEVSNYMAGSDVPMVEPEQGQSVGQAGDGRPQVVPTDALEDGMVQGDGGVASQGVLNEAVAMVTNGQALTDSMKKRILEDAEAMAALGTQTGLDITKYATTSTKKSAVKAAVEALAQEGVGASQEGILRSAQNDSMVAQGDSVGAQGDGVGVSKTETTTQGQTPEVQQLASVSDGMGKAGQSQILSFYRQGDDVVEYFGGYRAYYDAGVSGLEASNVKSRWAKVLSDEQQQAAYLSGQADAQTSLQAEKDNAGLVNTGDGKAGLVDNHYAQRLRGSDKRFYSKLAQTMGVKIALTDAPNGKQGANGAYNPTTNTIELSIAADKPMILVAAHEVTHHLQAVAPEQYRQYRDSAVNFLANQASETSDTNAVIQGKIQEYEKAGVEVSVEEAMDEIAADFTEKMMDDATLFDHVLSQDRHLAKTVLNTVRDFIRKVTSAIKSVVARDKATQEAYGVDMQALEETVKLWKTAYDAGAETVKKNLKSSRINGTMDATYSLKEGANNGQTKRESREDFEQRINQQGFRVFEGETTTFGYRAVERTSQRAQQVQEQLQKLGVPSVVTDGQFLYHRNGVSRIRTAQEATTLEGELVLISNGIDMSVKNVAGHEAFHFFKNQSMRNDYIDIIEDNLLYREETFQSYQGTIAEAYLGGAVDLADDASVNKLREELFAYISGDIHQGTYDGFLRPMFRDYDAVKAAWETLTAEMAQKNTTTSGDVKYSINPSFARDIQEWNQEGRKAGEAFILGSTGDVLRGLGAIESDIYINGDKISKILNDHPEMTLNQIQRIPEILEDPVLILNSKAKNKWGTNNRMVMFGTVKAENGQPIMAILDFIPSEKGFVLGDMQKVSSAYTKDNPKGFITKSEVLHTDKKRTFALLRSMGLQYRPTDLLRNGSIGSITYQGTTVNISGVPFSAVVEASQDREAQAREFSDVDVKYSIKHDVNNTPYVVIDQDILDGVPKEDWVKTVKDGLRRSYPSGVQLGRNVVKITSQSRKEMTFSGYMQNLLKNPQTAKRLDLYSDKLRATSQTDEILVATRNWVNEALLHPRKDAIIDFARGTVLFRMGKHDYTAEVIVGNRGDTGLLMYDIINLKATVIKNKKTDVANTMYAQNEPHRRGATSASDDTLSQDDGTVKYSLKNTNTSQRSIANNAKEKTLLQEKLAYWRKQTQLSRGVSMDAKAVGKATKAMVKGYGADVDVKVFATGLQTLYDAMANTRSEGDYTSLWEQAKGLATELVNNAVNRDDAMYNQYGDLRKRLRTTTLNIAPQDSADIADFDHVRKSQFGRLRIGTQGTNIDQVYMELETLWPEFFDSTVEMTPSDQLLRIMEVTDKLYKVAEYNPFSAYQEQAIVDATNEIMEQFLDLPQTKATFADKQFQKLKEVRQQNRATVREVVQNERDKRASDLVKMTTERKQAVEEAYLAGQMVQGAEMAQRQRKEVAKLEGRIASIREELSDTKAKASQVEKNAKLAGQMAQGRKDAKELRSVQTRLEGQLAKAQAELGVKKQRIEKMKDSKQRADKTIATGKERLKSYHKRQAERELRAKILRHVNPLSKKLLHPTDKAHIPEQMRVTIGEVLKAINLESGYELSYGAGATYHHVPIGSTMDGETTQRTDAFRALREVYAQAIHDPSNQMVVDPNLLGKPDDGIQGLFDTVISYANQPMATMNVEQLENIWTLVKAVEHSITTAGKILSKAKYDSTTAWVNAILADTATRRAKRAMTKAHFMIDMEDPLTFFSHYGNAGTAIYRMLRDAQDLQTVRVQQLTDTVGGIVDGKTVTAWETEHETFQTQSEESITLTIAHRMELYLLMRREQSHEHILKGGIVQPEVKGSKMRRGDEYGGIALSEQDITNILGTLSQEQIDVALKLQALNVGLLADWGNEATMQVFGYKKFTDPHYWGLKSAAEGLHTNVEKGGNNARSVKNMGFAQSTTPHASNAIDVFGVFDSFATHSADMLDYATWLAPMEDANRLFNFKIRDDKGALTNKTMKFIVNKYGGEKATNYWADLMEDIQNGIGTKGDNRFGKAAEKLYGNMKAASVGANLSVIVQQPTALFRAGSLIDATHLVRGLTSGATRGKGWNKALQYAPIALRKDMGGFDIAASFNVSNMIFDERSTLEQFNGLLQKGAGIADAVTWGKIWNGCEWQIKSQRPGLEVGSEGFYQAVATLFTQVVDQSQVVDGVLQRSQLMRSSDGLVKQATAFMGEPTKSYNMMARAWDTFRFEQDTKKRSVALKQFKRSANAVLVASVINAIVVSLVGGLRDDDGDKEYWQRCLGKFTGLTGEEESFLDKLSAFMLQGELASSLNPLELIPFVKDGVSLLKGYDVARLDMETVSSFLDATNVLMTSLGGDGAKTQAYAFKQMASAAANLFGNSAPNILRDVWSLGRTIAYETGDIGVQYLMEKAIYNLASDSNKSRYYDILFRALKQENFEDYEMIRKDLMDTMGLDGPTIDSAMGARCKNEYYLTQEALDLIGTAISYEVEEEEEAAFTAKDLDSTAYPQFANEKAFAYRTLVGELESSRAFDDLDNAMKNKVLDMAYNLTETVALANASDGESEVDTKWMLWATGGDDAGVDKTEAILFKLAYDMSSGENKKDDVLALAADWLPTLTDAELDYLKSNYWST